MTKAKDLMIMDQYVIKISITYILMFCVQIILGQNQERDDSLRTLVRQSLFTHNLVLELEVLPYDEYIPKDSNEDIKISASNGFVKISSYKNKIKLWTQRPSLGFHSIHLVDGQKDVLIHVVLEILVENKWRAYQKKENQNPKKPRPVPLKKNQSTIFILDSSCTSGGEIKSSARLKLKLKNKNYYSNEFEVYVSQEQIDSAREFFNWEE